MLLETQVKAINKKAELRGRLAGDDGSVIEEMGFKGIMIGAALLAGGVVAVAVGLWAADIQTP